jgi:hypothetical protein
LLEFVLYEKVNNGFRANKKYHVSINSPNFDEIVVHGRFELRRFGEADLRHGNDIPRGRKLKMYRFPCKLYSSKNSGSPRISFIFENTRETLADDEQLVNELSLVGHPFHDGVCKFIFHQDPKAARFFMDTLDPISFVVATRI